MYESLYFHLFLQLIMEKTYLSTSILSIIENFEHGKLNFNDVILMFRTANEVFLVNNLYTNVARLLLIKRII